jgi:GAF domain-containing protein
METLVPKSMICIPLIVKGRVIGTLSLDNVSTNDAFRVEDVELLSSFADQAANAIENSRLYKETHSREQLLTALDEASRHIRAEKEPAKLLHEIVRLGSELMGCTAGGLFIDYPHIEELELTATYGLPGNLIGFRLPYKGPIGQVAQSGTFQIISAYSDRPDREAVFEHLDFKTVVVLPLRYAGEVEAVLFVADNTGLHEFDRNDREIIERFAAQASIALHTSRLMDKEQRRFSQLAILHRISDYIQKARDLDKILHVVLTGVTAGYGLGFNRAGLLLLDEEGKNLVGRMGIGYLEEAEAREDWEQHQKRGLEDFGKYLEASEQGILPPTPVNKNLRLVHLPVKHEKSDVFSRTVLMRRWALITREELGELSPDFVQAFEPALPLIVVPMIVQGRVIGLLVADNKFTHTPITQEDINSLMTFANTAAIAINNVQLLRDAEVAREKISASFKASGALVASRDPEQVLRTIVDQAHVATGALWISLVLIDELNQVRDLITTRKGGRPPIERLIRENGISIEVMRTGKTAVFRNVPEEKKRVNPRMIELGVKAALCMPLSLRGKQIGVMWIHYDESRHFPGYEIEAMQLYVNQAAIAYDNARRMEELEHMRMAAEVMSGALELPHVLQQIVESATDVLQADSSAVWSYNNVRDYFISEELVAFGIPKDELERFRKREPKKGGTADTLMDRGWIGITDVFDPKYDFMGPSTVELLKKIGTKSFQGAALKVGKEKLGVLYVNYNRSRSFTKDDQRTLETFAYHAALALKKARLLDQVGKARDTAKVFAQVSILEDLRTTLNSIVRGTQEVLDCDAVTLYTYDQELDEFGFPPATVGVQNEQEVFKLGRVAKQSVVRNILALEKPHEADDASLDPLMKGRFITREKVKSSVGIPLQVGDRKVGVMFVNFRSSHRFTADESANIELFANQAAVAIRNAQLHSEIQKRADALERLYESGRIITSTLTLNETLDRIVEQALRIIRIGHQHEGCFSHIALLAGDKLEFVATHPEGMLARMKKEVEIDFNSSLKIGIVGYTVSTGQSQNIGDVGKNPDYIQTNEHIRSQLSVPLGIGEQVIGAWH